MGEPTGPCDGSATSTIRSTATNETAMCGTRLRRLPSRCCSSRATSSLVCSCGSAGPTRSFGFFQAYLKRHSAEYWPTRNDFGRRRGQIAILAAVVLLTGLIRAAISLQDWVDGEADSFVGGTATGMIVGLFVGPMAAAAVLAYKARSSDRDDDF